MEKNIKNEEVDEHIVNENKDEQQPSGEEQATVAEESPKETEQQEQTPEEKIAELEKQVEELKRQQLYKVAEFDNFRKRSRKEREDLYTTIRAETVAKFLPVFDDLERALHNETVDEAYKKGVELTMTELRKIMTGLGVEEFGEVGDTFDPNAHNAVMHVEDESLGENTLAQIFQKGFRIGEKVIRFAVVKVAN